MSLELLICQDEEYLRDIDLLATGECKTGDCMVQFFRSGRKFERPLILECDGWNKKFSGRYSSPQYWGNHQLRQHLIPVRTDPLSDSGIS